MKSCVACKLGNVIAAMNFVELNGTNIQLLNHIYFNLAQDINLSLAGT